MVAGRSPTRKSQRRRKRRRAAKGPGWSTLKLPSRGTAFSLGSQRHHHHLLRHPHRRHLLRRHRRRRHRRLLLLQPLRRSCWAPCQVRLAAAGESLPLLLQPPQSPVLPVLLLLFLRMPWVPWRRTKPTAPCSRSTKSAATTPPRAASGLAVAAVGLVAAAAAAAAVVVGEGGELVGALAAAQRVGKRRCCRLQSRRLLRLKQTGAWRGWRLGTTTCWPKNPRPPALSPCASADQFKLK
jgi:hypothetical protein